MKISLIAISIIIALNACTLLYNSQQRYVFHNTIHQLSNLAQPIKSITNITNTKINTITSNQTKCCYCFICDQQIRFIAVAFMIAAAILLFTEDAVWPAFLAQVFWIVFESYLCTDRSLGNLRNFAIQVLILYVIASNLKCGSCSSASSKTQLVNNQQSPAQAEKKDISPTQSQGTSKKTNQKSQPSSQKKSQQPKKH